MIVQEWLTSEIMDGMNTTAMAKRHGEFNHWEPIYIGTNNVSFEKYDYVEQ